MGVPTSTPTASHMESLLLLFGFSLLQLLYAILAYIINLSCFTLIEPDWRPLIESSARGDDPTHLLKSLYVAYHSIAAGSLAISE